MKRLSILLALAVLPVVLGGCVVTPPYGPGGEVGYHYDGYGRNDHRDDRDRDDHRHDRDGKDHRGGDDHGDRASEGHEYLGGR